MSFRVVAAAALGVAFEGVALFALAIGAPWSALALHVASAGALAEAFWSRRSLDGDGDGDGDGGALGLAWFWTVFFPGFGALAATLLLALVGRRGRAAFGESLEQRRGLAARAAREELERAQLVEPDVIPLVEALRDPDAGVRIAAIDAIRDDASPRAVRLLVRARESADYDVRFRAVEALGRVASRRLDELAAARRAPESPGSHRRLARLCFDYAELGLDSAEVTRGWLEQAVVHGAQALRARSEHDVELLLIVGTAYRRTGALDRAETALRLALKLAPASAAVLAGLAELQVLRRDFDGLRATRDRLRLGRVPVDAALRDAIDLWCGDESLEASEQPWASP